VPREDRRPNIKQSSWWGGQVDGKGNRRVQAERVESDIEQHIGQVEWAALTALLDSAIHVVGRFLPSSSATITLVNTDGTTVIHGERIQDGSPLSVPLRSRERTYGALNVYTTDRDPIADSELDFVRTLADHIANAVALVDASALNLQLQEAISTRQLIGEAKGILMASEQCSREEAFDILRRASQRTNRKLRDIAHKIVDAAEQRAQNPT